MAPAVARPVDCSRVRVQESKTKSKRNKRNKPMVLFYGHHCGQHHQLCSRDLPPECDMHRTVCMQGGATDYTDLQPITAGCNRVPAVRAITPQRPYVHRSLQALTQRQRCRHQVQHMQLKRGEKEGTREQYCENNIARGARGGGGGEKNTRGRGHTTLTMTPTPGTPHHTPTSAHAAHTIKCRAHLLLTVPCPLSHVLVWGRRRTVLATHDQSEVGHVHVTPADLRARASAPETHSTRTHTALSTA